MPEEEVDLGDSVFASLSMGQIKLRSPHPGTTDMVIYIEPETYDALRRFARKIGLETEPEKR